MATLTPPPVCLHIDDCHQMIKNNILPEIYKTYLSEDCDSDDNALPQEDFLHIFGLKKLHHHSLEVDEVYGF